MSTSTSTPAAEKPAGMMPTLREAKVACEGLDGKLIFEQVSRLAGDSVLEIPLEALDPRLPPPLKEGESLKIRVRFERGRSLGNLTAFPLAIFVPSVKIEIEKVELVGFPKEKPWTRRITDSYSFLHDGKVSAFFGTPGGRGGGGQRWYTGEEPVILPLSAVLSALEKLNSPEGGVAETRAGATEALQG